MKRLVKFILYNLTAERFGGIDRDRNEEVGLMALIGEPVIDVPDRDLPTSCANQWLVRVPKLDGWFGAPSHPEEIVKISRLRAGGYACECGKFSSRHLDFFLKHLTGAD